MNKIQNNSKTIAYGILRALGIIAGVFILFWFLYKISAILVYIAVAAVLSLIGRPLVIFLRKRLKMGYGAASVITLTVFSAIAVSVFLLVIPIISEQSKNISKLDMEQVRSDLNNLNVEVSNYLGIKRIDLMESVQELEYVKDFDIAIVPQMVNNIFGTMGAIGIAFFSILFITFFLLRDSRLLEEWITVFANRDKESNFKNVFEKIKNLLSRYFIGLVIQVLILFTLYSILLFIVGVDNALIVALICALLNLIPYLGPVIGFFLMVVFTTSSNLGANFGDVILPDLLWLFIGYALVQLIDNFANQPIIFSKSVKSHPLEIFIVILIAGTIFGIVGLIAAVPAYTAVKVISKEFLSEYKIVQKLTKDL